MKRAAGVRNIASVVALFLTTLAGTASAQGGALITGKVTNEQGMPLANANVFLPTFGIGAQTTANGTYSIAVPQRQVLNQSTALTARFIGFVRQSRQITLRPGNQ